MILLIQVGMVPKLRPQRVLSVEQLSMNCTKTDLSNNLHLDVVMLYKAAIYVCTITLQLS